MARELNMEAKHSLEKAAAHAADCFTTVSDITAIECEQLLEIKPHVVTPNGFEKNFVPEKTAFKKAREASRNLLAKTVSALTGKDIDSKTTFFVSTSGRCEYRNKGLDVYLDSLYQLRKSLKPGTDVVAFVMVPSWVDTPREDLRQALDNGSMTRLEDPCITHNLHQPWNDPVYSQIHRLSFDNNVDDSMTVVYVPCYLNGDDGIFNKAYYDLLIGIDATVFPSYYEPWGYTPLESVAFGVPTVTTSLSGFGQWVLSLNANGFAKSGVEVIARNDSNYGQVVDAISSRLLNLAEAAATTRSKVSKAAMATADKAAWEHFIIYYVEAFDIALKNAAARK